MGSGASGLQEVAAGTFRAGGRGLRYDPRRIGVSDTLSFAVLSKWWCSPMGPAVVGCSAASGLVPIAPIRCATNLTRGGLLSAELTSIASIAHAASWALWGT